MVGPRGASDLGLLDRRDASPPAASRSCPSSSFATGPRRWCSSSSRRRLRLRLHLVHAPAAGERARAVPRTSRCGRPRPPRIRRSPPTSCSSRPRHLSAIGVRRAAPLSPPTSDVAKRFVCGPNGDVLVRQAPLDDIERSTFAAAVASRQGVLLPRHRAAARPRPAAPTQASARRCDRDRASRRAAGARPARRRRPGQRRRHVRERRRRPARDVRRPRDVSSSRTTGSSSRSPR